MMTIPKKQNEYVKSHVPGYDPDISFENLHSEVEKEKIRDASYYFKAYGGAWRYNEIIGYIRIYKLGSQIRSEFWQTNAQKIVKTRKKQFIVKNRKLVPEFKIKDPTSNADIQQAMDLCIEKCRQKLKNRHHEKQTGKITQPRHH